MSTEKQYQHIDLKPYYVLGVPLLKVLFGITLVSLVLITAYEFFI